MNVFVVASTSSGKSVLAYHSISQSISQNKITISVPQVKSLANQQYFENVELITGDISIEHNSNCLVMTAEVLQNHILSGSSLINQVSCIILDEIHFIGDQQRGVVWEHILIISPFYIRFVMLTATLSNRNEICHWISHIGSKEVHLVYFKAGQKPLRIYNILTCCEITLLKNDKESIDYKTVSDLCCLNNELYGNKKQINKFVNLPFYTISTFIDFLIERGSYPLIVFRL
jgi:superfamily II RNA helicase